MSGPFYQFVPPPEGLPVTVLQRTSSRGFDALAILSLLLAVNWAAVASAVGLNLFSQWLYDTFKRPHGDGAVSPENENRIEIKIDGNVTVVVLTDREAVEAALRQICDGR